MEDLKLRIVSRIASWHPASTHHKLREERQVEAGENKEAGNPPQEVVVHAAKYLGPPVEHAAQQGRQCSTHHHEVKVSHHKVGIMQVNVDRQRS